MPPCSQTKSNTINEFRIIRESKAIANVMKKKKLEEVAKVLTFE
jgi:hypothetical protein